jgi:hypothetical protein
MEARSASLFVQHSRWNTSDQAGGGSEKVIGVVFLKYLEALPRGKRDRYRILVGIAEGGLAEVFGLLP